MSRGAETWVNPIECNSLQVSHLAEDSWPRSPAARAACYPCQMDPRFIQTALACLREAETGALASIGKRGTYAAQEARRAVLARREARWAWICKADTTTQPVTPEELGRSFYPNAKRPDARKLGDDEANG